MPSHIEYHENDEAYTTEIRNINELINTPKAETNYFKDEAYVFDESTEFYRLEEEEHNVLNTLTNTEGLDVVSSPAYYKE